MGPYKKPSLAGWNKVPLTIVPYKKPSLAGSSRESAALGVRRAAVVPTNGGVSFARFTAPSVEYTTDGDFVAAAETGNTESKTQQITGMKLNDPL